MISEVGIDGKGFRNQPSTQDSLRILLTRKEVAKIFFVSKSTLSNWEKASILIPLRIGATVRYKQSDVQALFNGRKGGGNND